MTGLERGERAEDTEEKRGAEFQTRAGGAKGMFLDPIGGFAGVWYWTREEIAFL